MNQPGALFADNQINVFPTHVQTPAGTWPTSALVGVRVVASAKVSVVFPILLVILAIPFFLVGSVVALIGLVLGLAGGAILVKRLIELAIAQGPTVWINVGGREFAVASYKSAATAQTVAGIIGSAIVQRG